MKIEVWSNFSKRRNSTLRPAEAGTEIDVTLKDETTLEAPSFVLTGIHTNYNYVKAFGRYYFVDGFQILNKNMCQLDCICDVLATYKTEIGNYTAFVERAASSYDVDVRDTLISAKQKITSSDSVDTAIQNYNTVGSFCLRIQGKGGIDQYIGTEAGVNSIIYKAYDIDSSIFQAQYNNINIDSVTDGMDQLRKILFTLGYDPSRYIVSLMWFPFSIGGGSTNDCYMGFYNLGTISGVTKSGLNTIMASGTVSTPARYYNDFRDYDNTWSRYSIYIPGVGETSLDASSISKGINYSLRVDAVTGNSTVVLTDGSGAHISTLSGNMGVSQQIGFASPQSALMNAVSSAIHSSGDVSTAVHGGISGKY